ncbi:unnamed protein product [Coregonus sp. 'balchen']|nr:unnamed protein product [Coregonus sp. 'balchen']
MQGCGGVLEGQMAPIEGDVCGAKELAFLLEPSDIIAVRDRPLMLDCQVEGEGTISITWRRNGVPVVVGERVQMLPNGTLFIQSFQKRLERGGSETDVGEYDCASQNRFGMLVSRKARVQLAFLPKFHTHPESMSVDDGGVARFKCQVNSVPEANITWERDRIPLSTTDNRYTLLPMGILQVTGVRRIDAGVYRCGPSRIYKEPVILSGPQNLTITVHQTAILECIATGNPRPIVSWSRLDGRSIGVEGIQVLGTGNLMISDVSLQHSGVYVCAANRPGTRMRLHAVAAVCLETSGEQCCIHLTLAMTRITSEDEAIYQCIAENMAGTNQASARLAVSLAKDLPDSPQGLTATALSPSALQLAWIQPPAEITDSIIGYVLHSRKIGEPDSRELQEAVSKTTFQHDFINLEPATTYSIYLKAYSSLGASQQSSTVVATTLGGVPTPPSFFTKVVNSTAVQVLWELPSKPGKAEGFRLTYRRVPHTDFQGPVQFPCHINAHTISRLETGAVYEVNLVAYNGNGESGCSKRLVSLAEEGTSAKTSGGETQCNCRQEGEGSMGGIVVGIHIGMACIIFCVLFLMFGYRRSKGTQDSWSVPRGEDRGHLGQNGIPKERVTRSAEVALELVPQSQDSTSQGGAVVRPAQCQVLIEQHLSGLPGTDTG